GAGIPPGHLGRAGGRGTGPGREPRRPLPRGPPAPGRRPLVSALAGVPCGRCRCSTRVQGREDGSLYPHGAEVLIDLNLRIRRYNPEVRGDPWWDEFAISSDPMDRLLDALHQVKWYHDGTLALRRSCAHGICGSDAM